MRSLFIIVPLAVALAACSKSESKEARCTRVCDKILKEEEAACTDDACKSEAKAKFESCKGLCATIAKGPGPGGGKSQSEQANDAQTKCEKNNDPEACATYGGALMLGKGGLTKDEKKGAETVKKACDAGAGFGCELYARALERGMGVAPDPAGMKQYMEKGCSLGAGGACRSFALSFDTADPKRIPFLEKACEKDDGLGCMGLGAAYLHGNQGAPKDPAKAKQFLQKACDLGTSSACDKAKEL